MASRWASSLPSCARLTKRGEGDTKIVLDGLAAISAALAKKHEEEATTENSQMMAGGGNAVSTELSCLSQYVRASSQEMTAGLNQVRQLSEALCSELKRGCQLAIHASVITELFDEQVHRFDAAFGQLGYTREMAALDAGRNWQDDLSALYSMESERKLHLEVFAKKGVRRIIAKRADSEMMSSRSKDAEDNRIDLLCLKGMDMSSTHLFMLAPRMCTSVNSKP